MAKKGRAFDLNLRRDKEIRRVSRMYGIVGMVIVIVTLINMIVQDRVYRNVRNTMQSNLESVQTISSIQSNFNNVNENVLLLVASLDTPEIQRVSQEVVENIKSDFENIDKGIADYKRENENKSDDLKRRFTHAEYAISAYRRKINDVNAELGTLTHEDGMNIYNQELATLQVTAAEMLQATIEIGTKVGEELDHQAASIRGWAQTSLLILLVFTVIFLFFVGRNQINSILEMRQKQQEITEASNRLTKSRKKLMDSAMTNILTGMKNRYALDESLSQLIGNAQFNIAVFDIDNFRMINDMYGYEFGDEYLATIAERLKSEYSEYAEMFNITGNEFCMVFYEHVSDLQAQQLSEQIRQGIGQPTLVANIPVQTTVSSSLYHYLPSDNLDVNTLLMKMDSALHAAKRDGGNRMYQIQ